LIIEDEDRKNVIFCIIQYTIILKNDHRKVIVLWFYKTHSLLMYLVHILNLTIYLVDRTSEIQTFILGHAGVLQGFFVIRL